MVDKKLEKVLLLGPVPPPLGGSTASFKQLMTDLSQQKQLNVNTISTNARKEKNMSSLVLEPLRMLAQLCRLIPQYALVSFHASNRRMLYFGCLLRVLCKLFRKPLMLRVFGGSFHHVYEASKGVNRQLFRFLFGADKVLLETQQMVQFFSERFPKADIAWFANSRPLDLSVFEASRDASTPIRFIFVGHVKPSKGVRELIQAAKQLGCRKDFVIDVYGPLQEGLQESEFKGSAVTYCGVLKLEEVQAVLKTYDVLVLPTHYFGEGYPGVILEAYSAGLPVIASDWQAIPEIVEHGVSGLLVKPKDATELARAIESVLTQPALFKTLQSGAQQSAKRFSSEQWHQNVFVDLCLTMTEAA